MCYIILGPFLPAAKTGLYAVPRLTRSSLRTRSLCSDLHPKKVTHKKSTGAKKVTFLEEKNGKRKCTSRSKNQSNN